MAGTSARAAPGTDDDDDDDDAVDIVDVFGARVAVVRWASNTTASILRRTAVDLKYDERNFPGFKLTDASAF